MRRADTNAVGPGGYGNASMASGWGKITLATLVVVGLLLGVCFVSWAPSGGGPDVLQRLLRREQVDAKSPISPSQQQPEPLAPGNVIGKPGGTRGQIGGETNPPGNTGARTTGGNTGTGPTGAGPAGQRP